MKRPCNYANCGGRRKHHDMPDEPRGTQMVDCPDDLPPGKPVYCSFTCAISDGAYDLKTGWINKDEQAT